MPRVTAAARAGGPGPDRPGGDRASSPSGASTAPRCRTSSGRRGLSVGAIYTYFRSKSELILAGCDLITDQELGELGDRLAGRQRRRQAGHRRRLLSRQPRPVEQARRGSGFLTCPGLGRGRHGPGHGPRDARVRRRETVTAVGQMVLQEGVIAASCRPGSMSTRSRAALRRLLDGMLLQAHEDGPRLSPRGRRAARTRPARDAAGLAAAAGRPAIERPRASRSACSPTAARRRSRLVSRPGDGRRSDPTGRSRDPDNPGMAQVQTVLGRIDPAELGWTLPHEHTAIALWHIARTAGTTGSSVATSRSSSRSSRRFARPAARASST